MLESLFNKFASPKVCDFIKTKLQQKCFPVNIAKFLRIVLLLFTVLLTLKSNSYRRTKHFYTLSFLVTIITIWSLPWLYSLLILLSADVELNPGPKRASTSNISICHWNLNSISAHNYIKLFLLKTYIAIHKFDIISLSETYLDSSTTSDDDIWQFQGTT